MRQITALNGFAVIRVKHLFDDRTPSGLLKDITFDTHGKYMIKAECISAPSKGSQQVVIQRNDGFPRSKNIKPEYVRNIDLPLDIQDNDMIYFHYLTLEDTKNWLYQDGQWMIFKVPVHDVYCSIRKEKIIMHNGYVLGSPYFGEQYEELEVDGKIVAGKLAPSGLITELKWEPLLNHATVQHIGSFDPELSRAAEINKGNHCMIRKDCEFINTIEGVEYWVFTHEDIQAKLAGGRIIPVGDYILVKPDEKHYEGNIEVDTDHIFTPDQGVVISVGGKVQSDVFNSENLQIKYACQRARDINKGEFVLVLERDVLGIFVQNQLV